MTSLNSNTQNCKGKLCPEKMVLSVYHQINQRQENPGIITGGLAIIRAGKPNVCKFASELLGISENGVRYHVNKEKDSSSLYIKPKVLPVTGIDDFDKDNIRRIIISWHKEGKHFTIKDLVQKLKQDVDHFKTSGLSDASLRRILKKMGFEYTSFDKRLHLMERKDIVQARKAYLRSKIEYEMTEEGWDFVFLDETWINKNHKIERGWTDKTAATTPKTKIGKGERLIITHAGNKSGFIDGALLYFWSKSGLADYHKDMNSECFTEWFKTQLIPKLESPSVIVMDNAPYQSKRLDPAPTLSTKKKDMQEWLKANGIPFPEKAMKSRLYDIIKCHKQDFIRYEIDEYALEHGHVVLRLPAYHCIFNPIELIWVQVKTYVAKGNADQTLKSVEDLFVKACSKVTADNWINAIDHCRKIEAEYFTKDGLQHITVTGGRIIVNLNDDSDDSSEDEINCEESRSELEELMEPIAVFIQTDNLEEELLLDI